MCSPEPTVGLHGVWGGDAREFCANLPIITLRNRCVGLGEASYFSLHTCNPYTYQQVKSNTQIPQDQVYMAWYRLRTQGLVSIVRVCCRGHVLTPPTRYPRCRVSPSPSNEQAPGHSMPSRAQEQPEAMDVDSEDTASGDDESEPAEDEEDTARDEEHVSVGCGRHMLGADGQLRAGASVSAGASRCTALLLNCLPVCFAVDALTRDMVPHRCRVSPPPRSPQDPTSSAGALLVGDYVVVVGGDLDGVKGELA
jgi:hypothetical protein